MSKNILFVLIILATSSKSLAVICQENENLTELLSICSSFASGACTPYTLYGEETHATLTPTQYPTSFYFTCAAKLCNSPGYTPVINSQVAVDCGSAHSTELVVSKYSNTFNRCGSIIQTDSEVFGEQIPISGVSFSINYFSNRVIGRSADYKSISEVTNQDTRAEVQGYDVEVYNEAGTKIQSTSYSNVPSQNHTFQWNGVDASGIEAWGPRKYEIKVIEKRGLYSLSFENKINIGSLKAKKLGLGGWVPSSWHFFDSGTGLLYKGDGSIRAVRDAVSISDGWRVAEEDGSLVYDFDLVGRHLRTRTGITGAQVRNFSYNTFGKIASIVEIGGKVTSFSYDSYNNIQSITSPYGKLTYLELDGNGYLKKVTDVQNQKYEMTYLAMGGLLETFKKPNGAMSTVTYSLDGRLEKDQHSGGYFATLSRVAGTISEYRKEYSTKMSRRTTIENKISKEVILPDTQIVTYPDGSVATHEVSKFMEIFQDRDFTSNISWNDDQRFGGMTRKISYRGVTVGDKERSFSYDQNVVLQNPNNPFSVLSWTAQVNSNNYQMNSAYTVVNRTWTHTSKLGKTHKTSNDIYERITSSRLGNLEPVQYVYTGDKLTLVKQGDRTFTYAFNNATGLLAQRTDPLSQTTGFVYDSLDRLITKVLPDLRIISYQYNSVNQISAVTPAGRPDHIFVYNSSELPGNYLAPPLAVGTTTSTQYFYNDDKQVSEIRKPSGASIYFEYSPTSGNIVSISSLPTTYIFSHQLGKTIPNVISSSYGFKVNMTSHYNEVLSQSMEEVLSGNILWNFRRNFAPSYGYLDFDSLDVNGSANQVSYIYNDDEDLTAAGSLSLSYHIPNGYLTGTTQGSASDSYTYNSFGEVTGYSFSYQGVAKYSLQFTRDKLGRIKTKTEFIDGVGTASYEYAYDVSGRLIEVKKNGSVISSYGYDANNNRVSGFTHGQPISGVYDVQDRITQYGIYNLNHDLNGDLSSKVNTLTSGSLLTTYDEFGNLTQATTFNGDLIEYEIDPLNRRLGKKINGVLQRRYAYKDNLNIIGELDSAGDLIRRYVYASKTNVPDYFIEGGQEYRMVTDHLGSLRMVIKVSDGTIIQKMDHDEFGRVTLDTNPGYTPFGFAGGIYDKDTSLLRFGARDYDPEVGRWTSKDPILFNGGDTNLFGYVENDPVNWIDINGLDKDKPGQVLSNDPLAGGGGTPSGATGGSMGSTAGGSCPIAGYTKHGINSAISRADGGSMSPRAILNIVNNPTSVAPNPGGGVIYSGAGGQVVINSSGRVITVIPSGSSSFRGSGGTP